MVEIRNTGTQQMGCIELKLEEYIQGVVAAEMPASFELEAKYRLLSDELLDISPFCSSVQNC
ncbi:MAG: SpoIID/LytB domain-containing protein [Syntrophomonas sp.]|uniref:SpoIID/LytB domain-containing protein n=1 Tax=Syntrophomonas sp. TaxID=2053627 RepID=UPI00260E9E69|nr:SpoIID/LytB domain-containing protein [Syntrophomonas sp.]MDD2509548.1 SpoIID/LytB domain-containing protein [Syntrophomonas sp.]MDD3878419.1 SpoIID/LytB domain-containing protein [Syntrophomonas sp.]MDD4625482.1 SpoIID/LytB domain-containing protein [Syntrophomonas sp.]